MKKALKAWVVNNNVTPDQKEKKILVLENTGSLDLNDVLEEMRKQDTGLRPETIAHVVDLFQRTVQDLVLSGHSVNTGLFHAVVQFQGVVDKGTWDPQKNKAYVLFTQDKMLRDHLNDTPVKIMGEKGSPAYIIATEDTATHATDRTATPGRTFRLKGKNIKVAGPDERVGIYLTDAEGNQCKLPEELVVKNTPSEVIVLLPVNLTEGAYELHIVTQFCRGGHTLKTPRMVSKQFFVNNAPDNGEDEPLYNATQH